MVPPSLALWINQVHSVLSELMTSQKGSRAQL